MVSDVPVGAFLSGGSSVICALAQGLESERPFLLLLLKLNMTRTMDLKTTYPMPR